MEKKELVEVIMSREMLDKLYEEKLGRDPVGGVIMGQMQMTRANFLSAKAMLELADLETVKKTVAQVIYDFNEMLGREAAEKLGNPTDLDSYIQVGMVDLMDTIPPVPPLEVIERTEKHCLFGCQRCQYAESIWKWKDILGDYLDDDTLEVLKARCSHDLGWANGFNPQMTIKRTQFLLDGDPGCYFEVEVP